MVECTLKNITIKSSNDINVYENEVILQLSTGLNMLSINLNNIKYDIKNYEVNFFMNIVNDVKKGNCDIESIIRVLQKYYLDIEIIADNNEVITYYINDVYNESKKNKLDFDKNNKLLLEAIDDFKKHGIAIKNIKVNEDSLSVDMDILNNRVK